jgi:hypothetical protein
LKFAFPKGAPEDQVEQMSTRLVRLAQVLNTTDG